MARLAAIILAGMAPLLASAQDSITVADPSFEQGYLTNYPGYESTPPPGWTVVQSGGAGINTATGPFWDNGGPVDNTQIYFMQGNGSIAQTLSGFQVGQTYWIQLFANARFNSPGVPPTAFLSVYEAASTAGSAALLSSMSINPVDANVPSGGTAGDGTPFTFVNVPFTAAATSGSLTIQKASPGDQTLLVDGVSVIRRSANDVVMANPSFEASGTGQASPGSVNNAVAGWTTTHAGLRINQTGGSLANNGTIPDGLNVLCLISSAGVSQALSGLSPGQNYQLSLYLNSYSAASSPLAVIKISGNTAYSNTVTAVGGSHPYTFLTYNFVATTNQSLTISNATTTPTNTTLLVDNVRVIHLPESIAAADPSFEQGNNATYPYYGFNNTWTWTSSGPGAGGNTAIGPFWNNGGGVDQNYAGFLQNDGTLGQPLSGFVAGQTYWIQCFVNAGANGWTDTPVLSIYETASTAGTNALLTNMIVTSVDPFGNAGDGVPFTFINVPFTAAATNGTLNFKKVSLSGTDTGQAVLVIDGISVISRATNEVVIANPSFEASGTNYTNPGYESPIAGWTLVGSILPIINQQNLTAYEPFLDNGMVPDGANVFGIQTPGGAPALGTGGISQMLYGLVAGHPYQLTLYLNGRESDVLSGTNAVALVTIDGQTAFSGPVYPSGAQGTLNPFSQYVSYTFTADSANVLLQIINEAPGGPTLLVDDVHVFSIPSIAPSISAQPVSEIRYATGTATFTASVQGYPLVFQWTFNGTNLPGATNATLTLTNLQAYEAGSYVLHVSNPAGSTNSSTVTLSLLPVFSQYASAVLANNPIYYWRFNDGETSNAYDYVGNVTLSDSNYVADGGTKLPTTTNGPRPPAFPDFESTNTAPWLDGLTQGYASTQSLMNGMSNYTITGWFYIDPTQYPFNSNASTHPAGRASLFGQEWCGELGFVYDKTAYPTPDLYFYPGANQTGSTIEITSGWSAGQWTFVAATVSSATGLATLYLNGVAVGTDTVSGSASTAYLFSIGKNVAYFPSGGVDNSYWPGSIDEVAVFNVALSPMQVLNLYYTGVGAPPQAATLTVAPSTNLFVGDSVVFSEQALGAFPFQYQWETNGVGLAGATNSSLTLTNLPLAASGNYSVIVSNSFGAATSAPVALSVTLDTTPPVVLRGFNIGPTTVELDFSKTVEAVSATNLANYVFTNGLAITAASLAINNSSVLLTTAPLMVGVNYVIVINGVRDRAIPPNTIATNTLVIITGAPLAQDIGNPAIPSVDIYTTNSVTISSAGNYIGGTSDQFNFECQTQTGNFDVTVCLAGLGLSDLWAEAGLMARVTLDPGSPFAAALATPGMNGDFFADRTTTNGQAATSGSFPVNYPNTWLRLNRVGNVFTGFGGYDGTNWTQLGTVTITMPAQIYLGLAVASHNTNELTTAQFLHYENTPTNAVAATTANPHEPLGPSSRKTGIVISEIMYKPAPRTDGNDVEFLEIYNSCAWFQDISSYQVTCADMNYTFPTNTLIPGGAFFVLAASPQGMANVYGLTSNVFGPYNGSLKHSETLELLDEQTNVLLTVPFDDVYPWPVAADGTGHSIVLANPTYGEGDPRAWDISDVVGGSPGRGDGFTPSPLRSVVINEILPHSENPAVPQFIELYNHSTNSVDVSGCILTDDPTTNKFVIPSGTVIGPAGFVSFAQSQFDFTLNGQGETLYFIKPDGSRILDAVQFGAQADGVSCGRWPDGAHDFYAFTTNTPGTNNSTILIGDIVINELMYDPISGDDDDQYLELYNKGTNTINLSGWELTSGVTFTFPTNAVISPNGYVVVGKNTANLLANYTNLNSGNTFGNYSGKLSHSGELVVLSQPESYFGTDTIYVEEDQVTYGTGGRWGEWSGGGGSSLELIDPRSNHRLAANWADSDETQKSSWVDIENTSVLDNGSNYDPSIDYAQMGLLDAGECLVDNIEVDYNGSNYVSNGTFESGLGLTNWSLQGCMTRSSLENSGYQSSYSLHIRCSDKIWPGENSCQLALKTNTLAAGQTPTLRFKARWLHGWPEVLLRLNGNWLEATAAMPVPANLGSPGAPNSQYVTNAGPALYNVTHTPTVPAANQAVVVTAQAHDPDGIQSLTLYYRLDPATNYTAVLMNDKGTGGDAIAGDGVFSGTIPGQASNQIAAFYIAATDSRGAATRFPTLLNNNSPVRECVVMFGDGNPAGSFSVYHLWITQTNVTRWANLADLSNEGSDCTFVNDSRVIYNMQGRFAGSPYYQGFNTPSGNLCHYKWTFNDDDQFLGATDFNKIHQPGNGPGDDASIQREELANAFLRAVGTPWLYKRYMAVYVNGNRRGTLMEDTQVPGSDVVKENFPNDTDGFLYKMQPWFEMAPFPTGSTIGFITPSWCNLMPYTTTGGVKKVARYRYCFEVRRTPDSDSDFTNAFSLIDAANSYGAPNYVANMENMANMENWMRVFAANHAAGNGDVFGAQNGQNLYGYIGTLGTKYSLLMWDFNIVFGNNSWGPGQNLFVGNSQDPNTTNIFNNPTFRRMYWRALQELVNGPLSVTNSGPLLVAKYKAFTANGLNVENPTANIEPWLTAAQSSIASQLAAVNATNFSVGPTVTITNDVAYVTGMAPVNVDTVWINGVAYPLTWTTLTNWTVAVPLRPGTNQLSVAAVDIHGQAIAGETGNVSAIYNGSVPSPVVQIVINEIMYDPFVPNAPFIELYNNSTNTTFDLSAWQIPAVSYTFANGASLGPNAFLVLAGNQAAYAGAYGVTNTVFDVYPGTLQPGQLLALTQPNSPSNTVVAEVEFDSVLPWPTNADGTGSSLQLIDPHQDNWRVGNWAVSTLSGQTASPAATNKTAASLTPFQPLWLNEVEPDNVTGITNKAGQRTPWLELYNPTTNSVSLNGLYLANNYSNLTAWAFPTNATINAAQFMVIFADSQTNLSTLTELHTSFTLSNSSGSLALSRLYNSQPQVLDYINYSNILPNYSFGSFPDGQSFVRQAFYAATPGAPNSTIVAQAHSFIAYNSPGSVYTQNFDSLPDPGATSVNTANPVTVNGITYSLANPFDFAYPVISSGNVGGLGDAAMAGWYGMADPTASVGTRFGATDGDQTTGGDLSFGSPNSSNRALGLLATSTTGYTGFGAKFVNQSGATLDCINLQFTGEVWRQSNLAKTIELYYLIDPTATNTLSTAATAFLPGLNITFPTVGADNGGAAVTGTLVANQAFIASTNQVITNWPPGAALWLVWEMPDSTGKAQGLGIDNLSFSATTLQSVVSMSFAAQPSGTNIVLSWPAPAGPQYQIEYKTNLTDPNWTLLGSPAIGTGATLTVTNTTSSPQGFYRVVITK